MSQWDFFSSSSLFQAFLLIHTKRSRASSAGGRYGGKGAFKRNADAKTEKYSMMLPAISRRSLLTGRMKSLLTF